MTCCYALPCSRCAVLCCALLCCAVMLKQARVCTHFQGDFRTACAVLHHQCIPALSSLLLGAKAPNVLPGRIELSCHPCLPCLQKEMADQMTRMRSVCISQVLGTDMKKHFQILSSFQVLLEAPIPTCHLCLKDAVLCIVWIVVTRW